MNNDDRTFELRFIVDLGHEVKGGVFDTKDDLLQEIKKIDERYGPLAVFDAEVIVYEGADVDPMQGEHTVIGKIDATLAADFGFEEENLKRNF